MKKIISSVLDSLTFGKPKFYRNLTILPVFSKIGSRLNYISMSRALEEGLLQIKEISEGGSVPQLLVINKGDFDVLIIDGEEVAGAKQNRIVNSSVLVKAKSTVEIPVSCTEQGRWGYTSRDDFVDSRVVMPKRMRQEKGKDVHISLKDSKGHRSNQGKVWDEIRYFEEKQGTRSATGAMKETFEKKEKEMRSFLEKCKPEKGQIGIMVFYKGTPIGLELVSSHSVYVDLHEKLIKSYAIESIPEVPNSEDEVKVIMPSEFIESIKKTEETHYKSVDLGENYRYEKGSITGSVLVHEDESVHVAFFSDEEDDARKPRERRA